MALKYMQGENKMRSKYDRTVGIKVPVRINLTLKERAEMNKAYKKLVKVKPFKINNNKT